MPTRPTNFVLFTVVLLSLMLSACQRPVADAPNPLPIAAEEYDRLFDASVTVLRDDGFQVDQADYRFGRITTQPSDSPIAFEFWRHHNATAEQAWQSTFDHLRRTVTILFEPLEPDGLIPREAVEGDYTLHVEVLLERRVQPTRRLIGASRPNVFSTLREVPAEWRHRNIAASYWEPVGRDPHMESRLMRAIADRAIW